MAKGPTVYDVAERAGVSIATVSFTFRQPKKVKESTRQLVHAAAEELGYIPSANARGLAGGRTGALGLLSPERLSLGRLSPERPSTDPEDESNLGSPSDPNVDFRLFPVYVDEVQRGVEEECWRRGYALMIASANRSNSNTVLTDIAGRVDGLAIASGTILDADLRRIAARLPVVVLSEASAVDRLNWVSVDNASGMRELTDHLIRAHGLRNLQFVGSLYTSDRAERFDAFRATLLAAGLEAPGAPLPVTGNYREMIADLTRENAFPDAFVCTHDEIALALMDALQDADIDVPGQVAVTGFDGIVAGRLSSPALTTVRQPMVAVGASAVRILVDRMERPDEPTVSERLPVHLLLRASCGCPAT